MITNALQRLSKKVSKQVVLPFDVVYNAEDVDAAVDTVDYDAIVLDLGLPDMDGIDVLKK